MNTSFLKEMSFRAKIRDAWEEWKTHLKSYPDIVHWWVHYAKRRIRSLFMREGVERSRDQIRLEEFYYTAIYEVLQQPAPQAEKMSKLKDLKAKIIWLNNTHRQDC